MDDTLAVRLGESGPMCNNYFVWRFGRPGPFQSTVKDCWLPNCLWDLPGQGGITHVPTVVDTCGVCP